MLSCNIVLVCVAVFIALFVHDTGELQSLSNVHAHTNRCAVVHAASKGFEDLARFDDGTLISIAGDHTHFEFKLGTSMRAMLRAKQQRIAASGASPPPIEMIAIDAIDGVSSMVRVVNPPRDFSSHGLAARGSVAETATLLAVNHRSDVDALEFFALSRDAVDSSFTAVHRQTFRHPLLFNVNDCAFAR